VDTEPDQRHRRSLLVIGPEPPPATGMELATRALLEELQRASVSVLRVDTADPTDELGNRGRWTVHNVHLAITHLAAVVRKTARKDVRVVYLPIAQEFPGLVRDLAFVLVPRLLGKPVVVHLHGGSFCTFFGRQRRIVRLLIRSILRGAARGIVLTESLRPALECVLAADRLVVVQNGIDLPHAHRTGSGPEPESVTALLLSSLFPTKGVLVFLEALALARRQEPRLRGVVAGPWPSQQVEDETHRLVEELSLENSVVFTGPVGSEEKSRVLMDADIFCLPSFYPQEGQPLVIIEAMAAGLPVVSTRWRGIPETVVDGETGLLVDAARADLVAEKLVALATDTPRRRRLGENGRARYERLYTQEAFGRRMLAALSPFLSDASESTVVANEAASAR
jgi:glycosyltransferase involved in cell wall biosynthesis